MRATCADVGASNVAVLKETYRPVAAPEAIDASRMKMLAYSRGDAGREDVTSGLMSIEKAKSKCADAR